MKIILSIFALSCLLFFGGIYCFFSIPFVKFEPNDVYVRLSNKTGWDVKRAALGGNMYDVSTHRYRRKSFINRFHDLGDGEMTEYQNTKGQHLGYSSVRVTGKVPPNTASVNRKYLKEQLQKNGAYEDSIMNVYSKKNLSGLNLPKGKYTFEMRLTQNTKAKVLLVDIIKDQ